MTGDRKNKDWIDNNTLKTPSKASDDSEKLQEHKMRQEQDDKVKDEPVESWGWVQNTD
ncbi:hypothetical protein [Phosphitispora fastidiosa]|uniref:hypothetical protein n=1 Tax=Phosphitispora fastidiosa TaxID=2837202 RepID=UPI001E339154|nr:hypothetical protein [Phosphitispora fastidiosa]MBU7005118.1 hypothetical protein [Phosphitispora fastidiosa]